MPKPEPSAPVRRLNPLLPSRPVALPFAGDWADVTVIYDAAAVMGLPERQRDLIGGELDAIDAINADLAAWLAALPDENRALTAEERAQTAAWRAEKAALLQAARLRLVPHLIVGVTWPFDDPPAPDPARPETFLVFPPPILGWLTSDPGALAEVEAQMRDPKEVTPAT